MARPKIESKNTFVEWYDTPDDEREAKGFPMSMVSFSHKFHVKLSTLYRWANELKEIRAKEADRIQNGTSEFKEYVELIKETAYSRSAKYQDRRLYAEIMGWLVEKKEETLKVEYSAADYHRASVKLIDKLREYYREYGGVCPVCSKPFSLPEEVCVDTEQEHREEGKMESLALPDQATGDNQGPAGSSDMQSEAVGDIVAVSGVCVMADNVQRGSESIVHVGERDSGVGHDREESVYLEQSTAVPQEAVRP